MYKILLVIAGAMLSNLLFGQQFHGTVMDAESKTPIPYASVYISDVQIGARTDSMGVFHFHISLPKTVTIKVGAFGYESIVETVSTEEKSLVVYLSENHLEIDEIVVSTPGSSEQRMNVTHVEVRSVSELNELATTNMGELLGKIPGVYNSSSGIGVSKPVIRGLQGVRVVSMLNGLRIENQQWGGDHGLGITELGIGNVEVLKGPASLLYGADALGGVIYYSDENYADVNDVVARVSVQGETATLGLTNQFMFKMAKNNHRFNIGFRTSDHADYVLPGGDYLLNSRFYDRAIKFGYGVNKGKWSMHARYNYYNSRVGIIGGHHHEEEEEHDDEEFVTDHQDRGGMVPAQNYSNHYGSIENILIMPKGKLSLLVGQTVTSLKEHEELFSTTSMNSVLANSVYNFRWTGDIAKAVQVVVGAQGMYQFNRNDKGADEILIPDANQFDNGLYSLLNYRKNKLKLQGGVRYDFRMLSNLTTNQDFTFGGVNFSAGMVHTSDHALTRLNISSGLRTPHLSEMFAEGEHHGAMKYEIGTTDLKSERGFQADLTQEFNSEHVSFVINPFLSVMKDYINLVYQDSLIDDLPVFAYKQIDNAMLYGADVGVHYHPHFAHGLHIETSFSYIEGLNENGDRLSMIPQGRLRTQIKYVFDMESTFRVRDVILQHTYVLPKRLVAPLETTSVDYHLLDIGVNMEAGKKSPVIIGAGVKNLLDQRYVDHLSRLKVYNISGPGRNIYLKVTYEI